MNARLSTSTEPRSALPAPALSFLIPFALDAQQRLRNLAAVVTWLQRNLDAQVIIGGKDLDDAAAVLTDAVWVPVEPAPDDWHPGRVRNALARAADTPVIALWDADVWCVNRPGAHAPTRRFQLSFQVADPLLRSGQLQRSMPASRSEFATLVCRKL